ncbi:hypothetical protein CHS0354_025013 [Potamilus streckersoni]|uniref:long-chain-fatty-acid--CoA ligase n=1 Tax=Potamilus streckersoni TaxID=2493646 RepID=A0AAE0W1D2_9BIVA|nr:hypothetical protein CHS0354_025013 [Potamilus streckersoni]
MADFLIQLVIGVFKAISIVYDLVAFIPYYVICRPDLRIKQSNRIKAKPVGGKPGGPYRSVDIPLGTLSTSLFPGTKTLDDLFIRALSLYGTKRCLGARELLNEEDEMQPNGRVFKKVIMGDYTWITYEEVFERATNFGSGLLALGQKPRKNILIFAETRADWMIAAQACFKYNFPVVTLYATLGLDAIVHGVNESEVSHVITSAELLPKFKGIINKMNNVTHLIYMDGGKKLKFDEYPSRVKLLTMSEVEIEGAQLENIRTPVTKPKPEDIAVIMYTSGSTGIPKGVLISHGNLMAGMSGQCQKIVGLGPEDTYVAYLPLAHVLELSAELSCLAHGTSIGYSSPLTLTDQSSKIKRGSLGDVSILRPTLMAAVPVIMDRLYKGVWEKVKQGSAFRQALFQFAYDYKLRRLESAYDTPILNRLVFSKIKEILGGELRMMLSGGAPLSEKTQRFMNICFCCPVLQGYGLTETCGAGTVTEAADFSTGRAGPPLTCCEIRLRDWPEGCYTSSDKPNPRGEVLVGGGNITMGYYKMEEKTKEDFTTIDGVRYFCTGDIGEFVPDGSLKIIDRKKDLVKLQHGEFISLSRVETALKMSPLVEQICLHANSNQSFSIAIIVPNQKNLLAIAKTLGKEAESYENMCEDDDIKKAFMKELCKVGEKAKLDKFELPSKVILTTEPWLPDSDLVTDAFKLKRKNIEDKYRPTLERLYSFPE